MFYFSTTYSQSSTSFHSALDISTKPNIGEQLVKTYKQKYFSIDINSITNYLQSAPLELTSESESVSYELALPMPDGTTALFDMEESPMIEAGLAAQYPNIKTYTGKGISHRSDYLKLSITEKGIHVMVLSESGTIFMDPYNSVNHDVLVVYQKNDFNPQGKSMICALGDNATSNTIQSIQSSSLTLPTVQFGDCVRRNYKLALAATAEYTAFHGGTVSSALAAMVVTINRVNGVYEKDLGVHLNLVANTNLLIYTNATTDPYSNAVPASLVTQNQTNCDAVIGNANYDLGHVFSTAGGGLSSIGIVCSSSQKAKSETGTASPVGDAYDIDYVAHEMGHQFNGSHTFNATTAACGGGNINAATAVETGSGVTVLSNAGICYPNDVAAHCIDNFHSTNLAEIALFITGTAICATTQAITNNSPVITSYTTNNNIPKSTPFMLTASATDADADALTYTWEQTDNQVITNAPLATNNGGPMFRCFSPSTNPTWYFPRLDSIVSNSPLKWQILPSVARSMSFRLTVRDNHSGNGCTSSAANTLTVAANSGPFIVTAPNTAGLSFAALSTQTVTWNVANTTAAPVSCINVDILLSTDGGLTYPTTILAGTPNDGSQTITIPNVISSTARIMVKANANIFFDISNNNFSITAPLVADYTLTASPSTQGACVNTNAQFTVNSTSILGYSNVINLAVSGLPVGATASFSPSSLIPGGSSTLTISNLTNAGVFNLTVNGTSTSSNQNAPVTLSVSGNAGNVTLSTPANSATNISINPTLNWASAANATSYELLIAKNNSFTVGLQTINNINTNNYTFSSPLAVNTIYYWKVRAVSTCNTGSYSTTNSFTTANIVCGNFISTDVPKTISALTANNITSTLNIPNNGTIVDLNVISVKGTHTYVSDLVFTLKSPSNNTNTLVDAICGQDLDFSFSFDDASTNLYAALPCPPTDSNSYQPLNPLSIHNGSNVNGTWTMMVNDLYAQDGGSLDSWGLRVCYTPICNIVPSVTVTNTNCPNNCAASAAATFTGGVSPVTYSWTNTSQTTATATNLCNNSYTVTITDAQGCTATATATIADPATPSNVVTTSPADNQTVNSTAVTFSWNAEANSTRYQIEVSTDIGFTNIVSTASNIITTSYNAVLSANTNYYWRVRGINNCVNGNYSNISLFTVTIPFTSQNNGLWSNPSTWDLGSVPGIGATVIIAHQVTVSSVVSDSPANLTINPGANLIVNNGTISITGNVQNDGAINFLQTNPAIASQLLFSGTNFINNGTLQLTTNSNNDALKTSTSIAANSVFTNNGTITFNQGRLLLNEGSNFSFNNAGTIVYNDGLFSLGNSNATFNNTGNVQAMRAVFKGVNTTINSASVLSFINITNQGTNLLVNCNYSVSYEFMISSGSTFHSASLSPTYLIGSHINYQGNTIHNRSKEWLSNTNATGQPYDVWVTEDVDLNIGNALDQTEALELKGDLSVLNNARLTMNSPGNIRAAAFIVKGDIILGNVTVNPRLVLSSNSNAIVQLYGNINADNSSCTLTSNGQTIMFLGSNNQTINMGGNSLVVGRLIISKPAGNIASSSEINLTASSGNLIDFQSSTEFNLQGNNLILNNAGNIALGAYNPSFNSSVACGLIVGSGAHIINGSGSLSFNGSCELRTGSSVGSLDFGLGNVFISSALVINHDSYSFNSFCQYQNGSSLVYSHNGNRVIGNEWKNEGESEAQPYNVILAGSNSNVSFTSGDKQVGNDLSLNNGCTFSTNQKLMVKGNVTLQPTAVLNFSGSYGILDMNGSNTTIQYFGNVDGSSLSLHRFQVDNNNTIVFTSDVLLTATSGVLLDYESSGTIDLNGYSLSLNNTALGQISIGGANAKLLTTSNAVSVGNFLNLNGATSFIGSGVLNCTSTTLLTVALNASATYNFSTSKAVFGNASILSIANVGAVVNGNPKYLNGSILSYQYAGNRLIGNEWANTCTALNNTPFEVDLYGNSTVVKMPVGSSCYQIGKGGLQINLGSLVFDNTSTQTLKIEGDIWSGSASGTIVNNVNSTIVLTGSNNSATANRITYPNTNTIFNLEVDKSGTQNTIQLFSDLTCNVVNFSSGNIDLNGSNNVNILSTILNEDDASGKFINSGAPTIGNGYISVSSPSSIPTTPTDLGNIGLELTLNALSTSSGAYTIKRFLKEVAGVGANAAGSLKRLFYVTVTNDCQASLKYKYFDSQLNGINDLAQLVYIYKATSQNGSYYLIDAIANQTSDGVNNFVTYSNYSLNAAVPVFLVTSDANIQVIKSKSTGGNWDLSSTWIGGVSPKDVPSADVEIDGPVVIDQNYNGSSQSVSKLKVNAGKSLTFNSGGRLYVGGSSTNNGTISLGTNSTLHFLGGVAFNNAGSFNCSNNSLVEFDGIGNFTGNTTSFYDIILNGATIIGTSWSVINELVLQNNALLLGQAPTYLTGSTLTYQISNTYNSGLEWSAISGAGYPYNVTIDDATNLSLIGANNTENKALANDLTIESNTVLNYLSTNVGNIHVGGDLMIANDGQLIHGQRAIIFNGTSNQTITDAGGSNTFFKLVVNKTNGELQLGSDIYLDNDVTSNNNILELSGGDINLGTHSLILSGDNSKLLVSGGLRKIYTSVVSNNGYSLAINDNNLFSIISSAGGTLQLSDLTLNSDIDFGNNLTTFLSQLVINQPTANVINNAPKYANNASLKYINCANYTRGFEWLPSVNTVGAPGFPSNGVEIAGNTTLFMNGGAGNFYIGGALSVLEGSSNTSYINGVFDMVSMTGNVYLNFLTNSAISLIEGSLIHSNNGGKIRTKGNLEFTSSSSFTPNNGSVIFEGTTAQTLNVLNGASLFNLEINNSNNLTLLSDLNVDGNINFSNGNINLNGAHHIVLNSTSLVTNENASRTFTNSNFSTNGYIEFTASSNSGDNTFGNLLPIFNTSTSSVTLTLKRYPSYNGQLANGRTGYSNIFSFTSSGSNISGTLKIPYSNFLANGNIAGFNKIWTSTTGDNLDFTSQASTDASGIVQTTNPLTVTTSSPLYIGIANDALAAIKRTTKTDNGTWSNPNDWLPTNGTIPSAGDTIVINNNNFHVDVNVSQANTFGSLSINPSKSLIVDANKEIYVSDFVTISNSASLTLQAGSAFHTLGNVSITNNGSISSVSGSSFNCHNDANFNGQNTTFSALRIGGSFNTNTNISITDTLRLYDVGIWVSASKKPTYLNTSTLVYSQGGSVGIGNEWSSISGPGYPNHVRILNATDLDISNVLPSNAKAIAGVLRIENGSGFTTGVMTNTFTVKGLINYGTLSLSTQSGSKLSISIGDFENYTNNVIANAGSKLEFLGTAAQTFKTVPGITLNNLSLNKTNSSLNINQTSASTDGISIGNLTLIANSGISLIGSNTQLNLIAGGSLIKASGVSTISGTSSNSVNIINSGTYDFSITGASTNLIFDVDVNVNPSIPSSIQVVNLSAAKVKVNKRFNVSGTTTITGYPIYNIGSTLVEGLTTIGDEWQQGNAIGTPYHVTIENSNALSISTGNYYVRGNLTLDHSNGTPQLYLGASSNLFVAGNISSPVGIFNAGGTIQLNGTDTQTIDVGNSSLSNLVLNKTSGAVMLLGDLTCAGVINFLGGKLNLNAKKLILLSTANILNETASKNIYTSTLNENCYVEYSANLGAASAITVSNNGGIGFTATTSAASGFSNVIIRRRYFNVGMMGGTSSISRIYELTCPNGILPISTSISYFPSDLNTAVINSTLKIFRSDNLLSGLNYIPTALTSTSGSYKSVEQLEIPMPSQTTYFTAANASSTYSGTYEVGSGVFANNNLQDVIAILNASGIGTGGAVVNLPPGYSLVLNGPLDFNFSTNEPNASNPLVISGDSLNPATIYAYNGGTIDRDAFVRILGTDFLTLKHINFVDPQTNTNQLSTMEWGIALLKSGPGNGIRFNTIRNCHVTMRKLNSISTGIYVGNHATNPNATYTPTSLIGTNSNNKIYSNIIESVNTGIFVNGYDDPFNTFQDDNWRIGDTTNALLGNIITNFGGDTAVPAYGIRAKNTNQIIVGHNVIRNVINAGASHNHTLTGIEVNGSSNANSYFVNNNITLSQGANAYSCTAIVGNMSGQQTLFIDKNNIHDNEMSTGSTGAFYGIYSATPPTTLQIRNNRVSHNLNINTTGSFYGIYNLGGGTVNITGNDLDTNTTTSNTDCYGIYNNTSGNVNCLHNNIREHVQNGNTGNFYGYCNDNLTVSAFQAAPVENINNNNFSGITAGGAINIFGIVTSQSIVATKNTNVNLLRKYTANLGSITGLYIRRGATIQGLNNSVRNYKAKGDILGIRITDGASVTLTNDSIADFIQLANGNTYGINSTIASTYASSSSRTISGNNIDNFANPIGGAGTTLGILHSSSGSGGPHSINTTGNKVSNFSGNGSGSTLGILHSSSGSGGPHSIQTTNNLITTISGTGSGSTLGILHSSSGSGGPHNIQTNSNIITGVTGSGSGNTLGILHSSSGSGGPHSIQTVSNSVSNISGSGSGSTYGILHSSSGSGGAQSLYRTSNTISNISNTGSGNTYGILHSSSGSGGPHVYSSTNNTISNIGNGIAGSGSTYGILHSSSGSGGPHRQRISNNNISNLSSNSDTAIGIKVFHADSVNIERNVIGKIRARGSNNAVGMIIDHNTANTIGIIKNNVIGDLHTTTASATDDLIGVDLKGAVGTNLKIYFNTIYLNDSNNTSGFSSSAFKIDNGSALDLRNNIIINNSTKTGGATVIKRSGVAANIAATSDYNLYYVNDSTTNSIFNDGVSNIQSFNAYKAFAQSQNNREKNNVQENVQFASLNPLSSSYLEIDPAIPTKAESAGSTTNLGVTNDRNGALRFGNVGYLGTGAASDIGAYESNYIPYFHTWVGDFSSEWSNALNWSANYLPTATDSVIIARVSLPNNQPVLASADATIKKITTRTTLGVAPTITVNAGRTLNVKGNIESNGNTTFTGAGKVELNGLSAQKIIGLNTFSNLNVNNVSGASIQALGSSVSINERLGLLNGNFNTNNNLTLKSNVTSTGYLSGVGSGTISGQVTVERRITGNTGYHYIGSAVNGVSVVPDWSDDFNVLGADNFAYNPSLPLTSAYSVWEYNEANPTPNMNYGWVSSTSASDALHVGKGFSAYINSGVTVDVKGTVNHGAYSSSPNFSLTNTNTGSVYADGFNLIANPYPSPISWSGLKSTTNAGAAKLFGAMHVWITAGPFANTYGTHNGLIGTNGITNTIPAEQGFFVQDSIAGPLLANNTIRVDQSNPTFYEDAILPNSMFISLEKDGMKDQTTLAFYNAASANFDSEFDAVKFMGYDSPNALIYTKGYNGTNYSLNFMPDFNSAFIIPLGIEPKGQGNYTISIDNLNSFEQGTQVFLEDASTGVWQDMIASNSFTVNMGNSDANNRFFLHFSGNAITASKDIEQNEQLNNHIYCNGNTIYISYFGKSNADSNATLHIYDNVGRVVLSKQVALNKGLQQIEIPSDFAKGSYIVKFETKDKVFTNRTVIK